MPRRSLYNEDWTEAITGVSDGTFIVLTGTPYYIVATTNVAPGEFLIRALEDNPPLRNITIPTYCCTPLTNYFQAVRGQRVSIAFGVVFGAPGHDSRRRAFA